MIFYEVEFTTEGKILEILTDKVEPSEGKSCEKVETFNKRISEAVPKAYSMYCVEIGDKKLSFTVAAEMKEAALTQLVSMVQETIKSVLGLSVNPECHQITVEKFNEILNEADDKDYLHERYYRINSKMHLDFFDNHSYKVSQHIVSDDTEISFEEAKKQAKQLLADNSLMDEIERIYAPENPDEFLGHPVHYRVICSEVAAGVQTIDLLIQALCSRHRLCGGRVDKIYEITQGCYDERDFEHLIKNATGNAVVIDMRGYADADVSNYASAYEEVIQYYDTIIKKNCKDVLFIFLEDSEHPGFSKSLIASIQEYIDIVDIHEGSGNREQARDYLDYLICKGDLAKYVDASREQIELKENTYTSSELHKIYSKWSTECLRKTVYTSYSAYETTPVEIKVTRSGQRLEDLVGLEKVKKIAQQIIATNVVDRRRLSATTKNHSTAKHMIFTGNPGSAKTTVARILAQLLKEEGVLESGRFVECGRGDLVAKYVGWTAKTVQRKFREAKGGVLFIDEAYSLVDDRDGSFGDEAISTIVQEMENHRDDVIVIFAGYPDKMKTFLDKNEGLRSRIAFHIDFPDYNADELMQIMDVMLKDREYTLSEEAREAAYKIITDGCKAPEFGNGRFVRNVLEQAIMKQSLRLYEEYKGKREIPKKKLLVLTAADFEIENVIPKAEKTRRIGFGVA